MKIIVADVLGLGKTPKVYDILMILPHFPSTFIYFQMHSVSKTDPSSIPLKTV